MPNRESKFKFETSLIFSVIFLIAILLLTWFIIRLIDSAEEKITAELEIELARLERSFDDKIDHTFSIINSINSQILEDPKNKKHISEILDVYRSNPSLTNTFSWTVFSWSDENYQIIVDAKYGVMKEPFDLSTRDYLPLTQKDPGVFHLGSPVIGSTSKKWMIPGGVGLADQNGKYLGAITIGFEIETLAKILHKVVENTDVNFDLFSINGAPILHGNFKSFNVDKSIDDLTADKEINKILNEVSTKNKKILDVSLFHNRHAFLAKKIDSYPYVFLLHYDKKALSKELVYLISSRLIEIFSIAFGLAILLILIHRERHQSQKTLRLKKLAEQANNSKSEFLIKTTHEFKNFVFGIHGCAEIIKSDLRKLIENLKKENDVKKNAYLQDLEIDLDLSNNIIESSHDLDIFINDLLDLSYGKDSEFKIKRSVHPVNISQIISLSAASLKKRAKTSEVILLTDIESDLHKITNIDPRRLKQIITSLIANSLKYSESGSVIHITAKNIFNTQRLNDIYRAHGVKKTKAVEIVIKDQGYGMTQREAKSALENINSKKFETLTTRLPLIKFLIEKQGGILEVKSQKNSGSEVRIIL